MRGIVLVKVLDADLGSDRRILRGASWQMDALGARKSRTGTGRRLASWRKARAVGEGYAVWMQLRESVRAAIVSTVAMRMR